MLQSYSPLIIPILVSLHSKSRSSSSRSCFPPQTVRPYIFRIHKSVLQQQSNQNQNQNQNPVQFSILKSFITFGEFLTTNSLRFASFDEVTVGFDPSTSRCRFPIFSSNSFMYSIASARIAVRSICS